MFKRTETQQSNQRPRSLYSILQTAIASDINIYNQAYLQNSSPLVQTSVVHPQTRYELGVRFSLTGEIQGNIYCLVDNYNKISDQKELNSFKSLFKESMNIALGKIITNLDEGADIFCSLSIPHEMTVQSTDLMHSINRDNQIFTVGYKIIHNLREFDCRIIINTAQKNISEV